MTKQNKFLFSVHDVAPVHLDKLMLAEEVIEEYGLQNVCFLLVPNFHDKGYADKDKVFMSWAQKIRSYSIEWFLHGFHHKESGLEEIAPVVNVIDRVKKNIITEGEGEFFGLKSEVIKKRLTQGIEIYKKLFGKSEPYGFVAPAWLFGRELMPCLSEFSFTITEDHHFVYQVKTNQKIKIPVITWATRTLSRKYGSLMVCPMLSWMWRHEPIIRIAVHPNDFEHSETVDSIKRVLDTELSRRTPSAYRDLVFPD